MTKVVFLLWSASILSNGEYSQDVTIRRPSWRNSLIACHQSPRKIAHIFVSLQSPNQFSHKVVMRKVAFRHLLSHYSETRLLYSSSTLWQMDPQIFTSAANPRAVIVLQETYYTCYAVIQCFEKMNSIDRLEECDAHLISAQFLSGFVLTYLLRASRQIRI